jgi:hypothetical protein
MTRLYDFAARLSGCLAVLCMVLALAASTAVRADDPDPGGGTDGQCGSHSLCTVDCNDKKVPTCIADCKKNPTDCKDCKCKYIQAGQSFETCECTAN